MIDPALLEGKDRSQRAAVAVNTMIGAKDTPGFSSSRMAVELAPIVDVSRSYINDAWRVWMKRPDLFAAIESGELTVWKAERIVAGRMKSPQITRLERAKQIGKLAAEGNRSVQISEKLGIGEETVRYIARRFGISLPDSKIGKTRRIDSRRVIENTVSGLEGYAMGLQTIMGAEITIDGDEAGEMARSIKRSLRPLNRLYQKLTEIANGKT